MRIARALALVSTTLTLASCSAPAEQLLLSQFFDASRLRDLTALQKVAGVVFEPAVDGIVTRFEIMRVTSANGAGGQAISKEVWISASVRQPDGRMVWKNFEVTMRREGGEWRITAISERAASPSTPRS